MKLFTGSFFIFILITPHRARNSPQVLLDLKAGREAVLPAGCGPWRRGAPALPPAASAAPAAAAAPPLRLGRDRVVLLEGVYALHCDVRPLLDLTIAITGGVHFDLISRIARDVGVHGEAPVSVLSQIADTCFPMFKARAKALALVSSF